MPSAYVPRMSVTSIDRWIFTGWATRRNNSRMQRQGIDAKEVRELLILKQIHHLGPHICIPVCAGTGNEELSGTA